MRSLVGDIFEQLRTQGTVPWADEESTERPDHSETENQEEPEDA